MEAFNFPYVDWRLMIQQHVGSGLSETVEGSFISHTSWYSSEARNVIQGIRLLNRDLIRSGEAKAKLNDCGRHFIHLTLSIEDFDIMSMVRTEEKRHIRRDILGFFVF